MILVCGIVDEPVISYVLAYLTAKNIDFIFIDERDLFSKISIELEVTSKVDGVINFGDWEVKTEEISGIFNRMWFSGNLDDYQSYLSKSHAINSFNFFLNNFQGTVFNRPYALYSNNYKLSQYKAIKDSDFKYPQTFIGNNVAEFKSFYTQLSEEVIVKSASGVRSKVVRFNLSNLSTGPFIKPLNNFPHQFQAMLKGKNIRVHVIKNEAIALRANTTYLDYRYAREAGEELFLENICLPYDIKKKCIKLAAELGLGFAGVDLFQTYDGEWYCFEVNPCPGYTWYERNSNLPITQIIINNLLN